MANAWRNVDAYILIGFKERPPETPEVVGIEESSFHDDNLFQSFIDSNVDKKIDFSYSVRQYKGKAIGVLRIPLEQSNRRPFYSKRDFGNVQRHAVYVRRGSSTICADPDEVARMGGQIDLPMLNRSALLELRLTDIAGESVDGKCFEVAVPEFDDISALPDFHDLSLQGIAKWDFRFENTNFWRELAHWVRNVRQTISVTIDISNRSKIPVNDCTVDLFIENESGVRLTPLVQIPSRPHKWNPSKNDQRWIAEPENRFPPLGMPTRRLHFKHFRPGEDHRAEERLILYVENCSEVNIRYRVLATELAEPIEGAITMVIESKKTDWNLESLSLLDTTL